MKEVTISPDNVFHVNRKEIAAISAAEGCDVASAARIFANERGIAFGKSLKEFEEYVAAKQAASTPGNNLVRR